MNTTSKVFAFLAYLLSIIGVLFVLIFRPKDDFAVYHAKQALGIAILAAAAMIVWFVVFWILVWIPYVGPVLGFASFGLVIATYLVLIIACFTGMVYAWQAKSQAVPLVGNIADKFASIIVRSGEVN